MPSTLPEEKDPEKLLYSEVDEQATNNEAPQHSILKSPKFEVVGSGSENNDLNQVDEGSKTQLTKKASKMSGSANYFK